MEKILEKENGNKDYVYHNLGLQMEDTNLLELTNAFCLAKGSRKWDRVFTHITLRKRAGRPLMKETGQEVWHTSEMA